MSRYTSTRAVLALLILGTSFAWTMNASPERTSGASGKTIVAQRYPLRSRSNNFFNRSKISATRK